MEIEFTNLEDKYLGRVKIEDGKLVGSGEFAKSIVTDWTNTGGAPEEFFEYFEDYVNQAFQAHLVTD